MNLKEKQNNMNTFANAMRQVTQVKQTENGAKAFNTTKSYLLDMFGVVGALRSRDEKDIRNMYRDALSEEFRLAVKLAFYARNIRGGLGERDTSRVMFRYLAENYPDLMAKNIDLIPLFGRWDDLYELLGTLVEADVWKLISKQLRSDLLAYRDNKPISLMAKWLKSANGEKETRKLGLLTARALGLSERSYRKILTALRQYLKVTENQMSTNQWASIKYDEVPSYAMKRYRHAFKRHDERGFQIYLDGLKKGTRKIKASTLFPYDLVQGILNGQYRGEDAIAEAQWKALPNYIKQGDNIVVMADVSGSMGSDNGRPMATSIGLALYFAQRNVGAYQNLYMTFTSSPSFIEVNPNDSLYRNIDKVRRTGVGYSTNLEAAFAKVLSTAVNNNVPANEMPKAIVVISDMEINPYINRGNSAYWGFLNEMEARFNRYGYEMPKIILWNCEARQNTFLAQMNNPKVQFYSGNSAATFRDLLVNIGHDAYEAMVKTLSNPMYDAIKFD
jgi:Mg-chelatase subunit ChlD